MLALQYDFKEGLEPSLEMLKDRTQAGSLLWYPLMVLAKFGSKEHIPKLEKHFDNVQELFGRAGNGAAETYKCLTRDSALLASILITKQDPKDYGFQKLQKSTVYLYNPGTTGFDTESERKAAFKKWKAWKKKNMPAKAKK